MVTPLNQHPPSGLNSGINVRSAKRFLSEQFKKTGVVTAEDDAQDIIMAITGFTLTDLALRGTDFLSSEQFDCVKVLADRRVAGEPVDSLLGYREFYGRRFKVTKDVLSPRGDTETLINCVMDALKDVATPHILDLGTGSGAIIVTLLAEINAAKGLGVDISNTALDVAAGNAEDNDISSRVGFRQSDWFENIDERFDLIVSNPPYITDDAMENLDAEVLDYDPDIALRGGQSGLEAYEIILTKAAKHLKPRGAVWVEIGFDQGSGVKTLFLDNGYSNVRVVKDISGNDRCVGGFLTK